MPGSLAGFVAANGRAVTLRTYTQGTNDADYGEPTWAKTDKTIQAVRDVPKVTTVVRSAAGDEVAVDCQYHVADADAPPDPSTTPGIEPPRVIDEQTFEVLMVEPPRLGVRSLSCKKVA